MFSVENVGQDAIVVKVHGDLDIGCRDALARVLNTAWRGSVGPVLLSLEGCAYCDCATIGALVRAQNDSGSRLSVVIPHASPLRRFFGLLGLLEAFAVSATVADALSRTTHKATSTIDFACANFA